MSKLGSLFGYPNIVRFRVKGSGFRVLGLEVWGLLGMGLLLGVSETHNTHQYRGLENQLRALFFNAECWGML